MISFTALSHAGSMSTSSSHSSLSSADHHDDEDDEETGEGVMREEDADKLVIPAPSLHPLMLRSDMLVSYELYKISAVHSLHKCIEGSCYAIIMAA